MTGVITLVAGLPAAAFALYNVHTAARWKRAELASSFLKELSSSDEISFVCRALEWDECRLIVPKNLLSLSEGHQFIHHTKTAYASSMPAVIDASTTPDVVVDLRTEIYRAATDTFLRWLEMVRSAIERKLFRAEDLEDVAYWLVCIERATYLRDYIDGYGYRYSIDRLDLIFSKQVAAVRGRLGHDVDVEQHR